MWAKRLSKDFNGERFLSKTKFLRKFVLGIFAARIQDQQTILATKVHVTKNTSHSKQHFCMYHFPYMTGSVYLNITFD